MSCVAHDDVMTSLVVNLILWDSLSRQSCVMSVHWYLRECRLRHCVDEDDDELRVQSKRFRWTNSRLTEDLMFCASYIVECTCNCPACRFSTSLRRWPVRSL